jgi:prophage regulatory protein
VRILRLSEVQARVGLKHTALYDKINSGLFPRPLALGTNAIGFLESEVNAWIEARIAERDSLPPGLTRQQTKQVEARRRAGDA